MMAGRLVYWTDERIIEHIRNIAVDGVASGSRSVAGATFVQAARYRYGTWAKACEAAGVKPSREPRRKGKVKPFVDISIEEIRKRAAEIRSGWTEEQRLAAMG